MATPLISFYNLEHRETDIILLIRVNYINQGGSHILAQLISDFINYVEQVNFKVKSREAITSRLGQLVAYCEPHNIQDISAIVLFMSGKAKSGRCTSFSTFSR